MNFLKIKEFLITHAVRQTEDRWRDICDHLIPYLKETPLDDKDVTADDIFEHWSGKGYYDRLDIGAEKWAYQIATKHRR